MKWLTRIEKEEEKIPDCTIIFSRHFFAEWTSGNWMDGHWPWDVRRLDNPPGLVHACIRPKDAIELMERLDAVEDARLARLAKPTEAPHV